MLYLTILDTQLPQSEGGGGSVCRVYTGHGLQDVSNPHTRCAHKSQASRTATVNELAQGHLHHWLTFLPQRGDRHCPYRSPVGVPYHLYTHNHKCIKAVNTHSSLYLSHFVAIDSSCWSGRDYVCIKSFDEMINYSFRLHTVLRHSLPIASKNILSSHYYERGMETFLTNKDARI